MTLSIERNYEKEPREAVEHEPVSEVTESAKREIGWRGLHAAMTTLGQGIPEYMQHPDNEQIRLGDQ